MSTEQSDVWAPLRHWPSTTVAFIHLISESALRDERRLQMAVADWSGSLLEWDRQLRSLKGRIGHVFGRSEVRETAGAFLDGLLAGVERKTGWLLSEAAGIERPYRMQSLLGRSRWD